MVVAVDASVAVPLILENHPDHRAVMAWADGRDLALAGHAEVETYAVLTRLPAALRLSAASAARALSTGFSPTTYPTRPDAVFRLIAAIGVIGGAVYDALVAIAANEAGLTLATRDARAIPPYAAVGVHIEIVA